MAVPGPVVITVGFIGYLVGGIWGAVAASLGVFLPVYLVVVLVTPVFERIARTPQINAFIQGVTAAATGAIGGAVVVLGRSAFDLECSPIFLEEGGAPCVGISRCSLALSLVL